MYIDCTARRPANETRSADYVPHEALPARALRDRKASLATTSTARTLRIGAIRNGMAAGKLSNRDPFEQGLACFSRQALGCVCWLVRNGG